LLAQLPPTQQPGRQAAKPGPQMARPKLLYRTAFKAPPKGLTGLPITPAYLQNQNLELKLYGPGKELIYIDHHETPKDEPDFVWSGLTPGPWGLAFRDKNNYVDLTGVAKIRWSVWQTGFHQIRPIVKLADGTWLIGDQVEDWTPDWHTDEFWPSYIRWRRLNVEKMMEERSGGRGENGKWEENPDLSKVDEIGFADLMAGSGHGEGGSSRVDWVEVYANSVKREAAGQ
jgi:hypothetical protein